MSAGNNDKDEYFLDRCEASKPIYLFPYTVFAMLGMLWYYVLMIDLAVFNNKVSAYVLVVDAWSKRYCCTSLRS